ncbi:MAG: mevalonate kinase [Streptococcaceae bacterium]|nr:mevalonate kinase [Streptococcaceae bacterium]MCL2681722.1 mevalonate kinase [Streptococcaceae bacterium]MCL2858253.1 mevalonate kinase [Streptococcaceae bacterium]
MTNNKIGIGSAHGKLILIGEHSVVYNQPAIALPVKILKTTITISETRYGQYIENNEFRRRLDLLGDEFQGIRQLILKLLEKFQAKSMPFSLEIESNIPLGRGLGASAALATSITRAFFDMFKVELSQQELKYFTDFSENITHGKSSGIDTATVNSMGPLWFIKGQEPESVPSQLSGYLVIGDSGIYGLTSKAIGIVQEKFKEEKSATHSKMLELGQLSEKSKSHMIEDNVEKLGSVMTRAHKVLSNLGVSHPKLDALVNIALEQGAKGAKLTGSGLGGVMIALAADEKSAITISQKLLKSGAKNTWIYSFDKK